ncbi:MAG: transposase [Proteobacteria bacterium]|nr:transposase [Pseudomonadota bacterium]MBU4297414.1 transposase [Pseudomonadota bacterium]
MGVTGTGHRLFSSLQSGDKESSSTWWEFFKDLKVRGLDGKHVVLWVSWMAWQDLRRYSGRNSRMC